MEIEELTKRLEAGVQSRRERWPGNDGEDIVTDVAGACRTMQEAATVITVLSQTLDAVNRENDRYVKALGLARSDCRNG